MHARRFLSLIALAAVAIIVLLSLVGCTKDRPTGPILKPSAAAKAVVRGGTVPTSIQGEKDYPILYSHVSNDYWVYTYSSKTGQVVDSARYGHTPFRDVRFSRDGRYAYYTNPEIPFGGPSSATWVTDFRTGDTLSILYDVWGLHLSISSDNRYLLISNYPTLRLLEIPTLNVVYEYTGIQDHGRGAINPRKNVAYLPTDYCDSLKILDFQSLPVHTRDEALKSLSGNPACCANVAVSTDGRILILDVVELTPPYRIFIQLRDSETFKLLREYRANLLGPVVHPDGDRVFFWVPVMFTYGNYGSVWVLNLRTQDLKRILYGADIVLNWPFFFTPNGVEITPDGKYAFIINGGEGFDYGPILKIDLQTYKIVDQFCPPGGVSRLIRIYPHEIKQGVDHVPEVF